jgi:hypothetical protein
MVEGVFFQSGTFFSPSSARASRQNSDLLAGETARLDTLLAG